jgi:hypothetical protein
MQFEERYGWTAQLGSGPEREPEADRHPILRLEKGDLWAETHGEPGELFLCCDRLGIVNWPRPSGSSPSSRAALSSRRRSGRSLPSHHDARDALHSSTLPVARDYDPDEPDGFDYRHRGCRWNVRDGGRDHGLAARAGPFGGRPFGP